MTDISQTATTTTQRRSPSGVIVLLLLVTTSGLVAVGCGGGGESRPEEPTYSFLIPAGSGDRIEQGEALDILPRELVAELNETVIIVNEDDEAHILGPWFVGPGETLRQRFTTVGTFEDSCSVHPSGRFTVVVEA